MEKQRFFFGLLVNATVGFETLADEIDEVIRHLPNLVKAPDREEIDRIRHRLQNGLNLVGATSAVDQLEKLANGIEEEEQLEATLGTLTAIIRELRAIPE